MAVFEAVSTALMAGEWLFANLQGKGTGASSARLEVSRAAKLIGQINLAIDVGANVGSYSEALIAHNPLVEIHLFEPQKINHMRLSEKFSQNPNVTLNQLALSNENKFVRIYSDEEGSGLGSLSKRRLDHFSISFTKEERIRSIRFEDYWINTLEKRAIDLCKLDIEGHELKAIEGFGSALNAIRCLQFEFGGANIDSRSFFQDFWYLLTEHKFKLFRISPLGLVRVNKYREIDEFFVTTNYLAKRN